MLTTSAVAAQPAYPARTECTDVKAGHRIVLIPWFVPTEDLIWKTNPAKDPQTDVAVDPDCDGLVVSPAVRDPSCYE